MLKVKPGEKILRQDIKPTLIARCGMNCALCMGYLRDKNRYHTKYRMSMVANLRKIWEKRNHPFAHTQK